GRRSIRNARTAARRSRRGSVSGPRVSSNMRCIRGTRGARHRACRRRPYGLSRDAFITAGAFDASLEVTAPAVALERASDGRVATMRSRGRILVAYSGGVDSGLVARVAHDAV